MSTLHLFRAPLGVPFFMLLCLLALSGTVRGEGEVGGLTVEGSDFHSAREALREVIEAEGMVVGNALSFERMLERTGAGQENPYHAAEIVQFCSAGLARRMVGEDAGQIVFCPLSISVYVTKAQPEAVVLAYRAPGNDSAARRQASELLARLVERAAKLAKLRW